MPTSTSPRRVNATLFVVALLGVLNVGMLGGGAYLLSGVPDARMGSAAVDRAAKAAEQRSQVLARHVLSAGQDLGALTSAVRELDREGVDYALAGEFDGHPKVVSASEPGVMDHAPEQGLLDTLKGHKPDGEMSLSPAHKPGSFYTAYYEATAAETAPAAPMAPAPQSPPPRKALAVIKRTVKKQLPSTAASTYQIKPGDTLYKIAREHYGDETMFAKIWETNKGVIGADRSRLPVGATLQLPEGPGKTVEVEENVVVYPSEAPVVVNGPTRPAPEPAATKIALRLTVPIEGREALPLLPRSQRALLLGIVGALIAGLSWWLAVLLMAKQRRRQLDEQKAAILETLGDRLAPHNQVLDRSQLHSSWQVEHGCALMEGEEPGGSFTDFRVFSENRLGLFIGDATGWNAGALVARGLADGFWRARASQNTPPAQTLLEVNQLLTDYISQGDHVTALYAQVDLLSGAVTYASAAHTGAFVLGRRGDLTMLTSRGMPLGVGRELFTDRLEEGHVRLQEGESLLLLTDGVLKAEGADGEPFGLERLEKCLRGRPGCDADAVVATIRDAVMLHVGGDVLQDESAILCLRLVNPLVLYPRLVVEPVGTPAQEDQSAREEQPSA